MSIITTFPTVVPELNDLVLGTKIKEGGNTTKNFRIGEVLALINSGEVVPPTVNYGLFSQTQDSQAITNTTSVRNLFRNGVGSQTIAAGTLISGDSFNINSRGVLSCLNLTVLTIVVTTSDGTVLATSNAITMRGATSKSWYLDTDITVRQTGIAGVASVATSGTFAYSKDGDNIPEMVNFTFVNNATFDTTIPNNIIVTAQWTTASTSNSIYSNIYNFTKTY
jgi:hypothetical protein